MEVIIALLMGILLLCAAAYGAFLYYQKIIREAKNYERGLKMVPLRIHLPPSSDDIEGGGRDSRDVAEEAISQAQVMYSIIASTATNGFKSNMYGQRHLAFELVASRGAIHYYVVVPLVLEDVIKQAVIAAYPTARLERAEEQNIFSKTGKITGTIGGELTLKKSYVFPIATFQETKRDAMQAMLNALSTLSHEDGAAVQMLVRPANDSWSKAALSEASDIRKGKKKQTGINALFNIKDLFEAFWKAPDNNDEKKPSELQISTVDQAKIEAIEEKTKHPGYETMIRVVASSNTAARSQAILKNIVAAFSLFESSSRNGFKLTPARDIESFTTSFILRFFPQNSTKLILNSVELATIFHLPDQKHTQTSQLQRQASKQVDGPHETVDEGILLGYNVFRGVKKQIRLGANDRRRHSYIIGQTGTGKSGFLENLALQDMLDGRGFAFIDPHGDSAKALLGMVPKERIEDVIYFDPAEMEFPVGLNLFEFETKDQRDFLVQEAIAMLYRLYDPGHTGIIGPRYEHWFRNAALTIMSDPAGSSFIDIPQVFNDNDFAKAKLKHVTDQTVLDFWNKEMAQTSDYHKSEVLGWFVSKFGAFLSNEMMRNIIGQTKSGFNLRDIMDNKKILLVNLSKGRTGELNSQLLGMIFVMKFQAAAMGRANIPEEERQDFTLYVDEFQNFATDSFESILSEARKYRLNLVLANQFMTQLTDKIREAIIGNVGTIIAGRIGVTDAELMVKKFSPVFDVEDLTKLPNFETVASVMINNVPSSPFSMSLVPPLGKPNPQLADALRRLSASKHGRPRAQVESEIFTRLRSGEEEKKQRQKNALEAFANRPKPPSQTSALSGGNKSGSSFLDEWLAKRQKKGTSAAQPGSAEPALSSESQSLNQAARMPQSAGPQATSSASMAIPNGSVAQPGVTTPAAPPQYANPGFASPQSAVPPSPQEAQALPAVQVPVPYTASPAQVPPPAPAPTVSPADIPSLPNGMHVNPVHVPAEEFKGVKYAPQQIQKFATLQDGISFQESMIGTEAEIATKREEQHELRVQDQPASSEEPHHDEIAIDLRGNIQYKSNDSPGK